MKFISFIFNMRKVEIGCLLWLFIFLGSCSNPQNTISVFWSEGQSTKPPIVEGKYFSEEAKFQYAHQKVLIEKQYVEQVPIENSYIKKILDSKNNLIFLNGKYETSIQRSLSKKILNFKKKSSSEIIENCLAKRNILKQKKVLGDPQLSIRLVDEKLEAVVKVDVLSENQKIETWICDDNLNLLSVENASSGFDSVKALAYPEGPKLTPLSTVLLRSINSDSGPSLAGDQINISTESPFKVAIADQIQYYPPDERFDQVQVYYYLQKALSWFERNQLIEPERLHFAALLHVGYPEKTNAAFYFRGLIRLGAGDDAVFSKIFQDPSIVIHESSHGLIEALAALPYDGEGGSLNEGFADTLTTLMLNNSKLGEVSYKKSAFKRDVQAKVKFSERNGGLYHDSAIVSSYFWSLKEKVSEEHLLLLIKETLIRLTPFSNLDEYKNILKLEIPKVLTSAEAEFAITQLNAWE